MTDISSLSPAAIRALADEKEASLKAEQERIRSVADEAVKAHFEGRTASEPGVFDRVAFADALARGEVAEALALYVARFAQDGKSVGERAGLRSITGINDGRLLISNEPIDVLGALNEGIREVRNRAQNEASAALHAEAAKVREAAVAKETRK